MAKLHAAFVGAALSALAMAAATPAAATPVSAAASNLLLPAIGGQNPIGGTSLVTTNVEAGAAAGHGAKAAVISVDPSVTHPGGSIDLRTFADCGAGGPGSITSPAFAGSVPLTTATDGGLYAEGPVARDTKPGTYPVLELCGSKAVAAGTVTVVRAVAPETGGGWGATREAAALTGAGTLPGGAAGSGALALTGAAALSGLYYLLRRRLFTAVGRDVGRG